MCRNRPPCSGTCAGSAHERGSRIQPTRLSPGRHVKYCSSHGAWLPAAGPRAHADPVQPLSPGGRCLLPVPPLPLSPLCHCLFHCASLAYTSLAKRPSPTTLRAYESWAVHTLASPSCHTLSPCRLLTRSPRISWRWPGGAIYEDFLFTHIHVFARLQAAEAGASSIMEMAWRSIYYVCFVRPRITCSPACRQLRRAPQVSWRWRWARWPSTCACTPRWALAQGMQAFGAFAGPLQHARCVLLLCLCMCKR